MTAEIAILNRQAIALAADSAVTINFPDGQKIYNSVNKLFMLSKYAPVGVMIYGVADLTGVPWETIIKSFRRDLGDERLPHLKEYAIRLIEYINGHKLMFSDQNQERQLISSVFGQFIDMLRHIDERIEKAIPPGGSIDRNRVRSIVTSSIKDTHSKWTRADQLPGAPANHAERIVARWRAQIDKAIDYAFEKLPISATSRKRLIDIASLVFTANLFPENVSGVVVAGFGEEDYMPGVVAYDMEGILLNFVKVRQNDHKSTVISGTDAAAIIPFAQGEMVCQFMEGVDPGLRHMLQHFLEDFVGGLTDNLVRITNAKNRREVRLRGQVKQAEGGLTEKFFKILSAYSFDNHVVSIRKSCDRACQQSA